MYSPPPVGQSQGNPIRQVRYLVGDRMDEPLRQEQVTMIGEHDRLIQQPADQGNVGRIQLGQVQVDDISMADIYPGPIEHGRHEHTLADMHQHMRADDLHTIP